MTLLLEARTAIYKALKKACDKNAPCLAYELSIKCNLKEYQGGMYEGYFEGKRAYDMVMTRMTIKATQNDDNLYTSTNAWCACSCTCFAHETWALPTPSTPTAPKSS